MFQKNSIKNRRGVSNIIGSLIVLAIVASVGSVILFQGLNQINAFNYDLTLHDKEHVNELREDIIFEHVRFDTTGTGKDLVLYLANIGSVDSTIATITVVKIDTQELIFARESPPGDQATILIEDNTIITLENATLSLGTDNIWNSTEYGPDGIPSPSYKISVSTAKGNFFSTIASPWNT
jgi:flagellin-like protein